MGLPTLLDPFASQQQAGQGANGEQLGAEDFWKQATGLTDPAAQPDPLSVLAPPPVTTRPTGAARVAAGARRPSRSAAPRADGPVDAGAAVGVGTSARRPLAAPC